MTVRLSALSDGRALTPQKDLLVFISVAGRVNPRATVRLEGIEKKSMAPLGIEPATFRPDSVVIPTANLRLEGTLF
jgi:hypothetical protein